MLNCPFRRNLAQFVLLQDRRLEVHFRKYYQVLNQQCHSVGFLQFHELLHHFLSLDLHRLSLAES